MERTTRTALSGAAPRVLDLPGRGRTIVWDAPGPPGAPTLFLVHGVTLTAALNWGGIVETLARRYRVVLVDQRGHGDGHGRAAPSGSRTAPTTSPRSPQQLGINGWSPSGTRWAA